MALGKRAVRISVLYCEVVFSLQVPYQPTFYTPYDCAEKERINRYTAKVCHGGSLDKGPWRERNNFYVDGFR